MENEDKNDLPLRSKRILIQAEKSELKLFIQNGWLDNAKVIVRAMEDLDQNIEPGTVLIFSTFCRQINLCEYLLTLGVNLNKIDETGFTALMIAVSENYFEETRFLLSSGADVNVVTQFGRSALSHAVNNGHLEMAKYLLSVGANIDLCGGLALMDAAFHGFLDMLLLLHQSGVDINYVDIENSCTALHMASAECHIEFVKFLLENGADTNIKDCNGKTPDKVAKNNDIKDLILNFNSSNFLLK